MSSRATRKQKRRPARAPTGPPARRGARWRLLIGPALGVLLLLGGAAAAWSLLGRGGEPVPVPVPADWSLLPPAARQPVRDAVDACRQSPGVPQAFTHLGLLYHGNAQPALAIAAYERALALGAADAQTPYLLGLLYEDWGRTPDAIARLRAALERDPGYAPVWYHLGLNLLETTDTAAAVEAFQRAVSLDPAEPALHVGLGRALRRAARLEEAERSLQSALAIDPENPAAHQLLGLTLRSLGRDEAAQAHLERVRPYTAEIVRDPWLLETYKLAATLDTQLEWARAYIAAARLDTAVSLLEKLAADYPDRAEVFRRLGEAYTRSGRAEPAAEAYARAAAIEPYDATTLTALAENLLLRQDLDGARRQVELALSADPGNVNAQVIDCAITLRRGRPIEAADRLAAITATRGDHVAAHYWLGEALLALGRYDDAAVAYGRALELQPGLASARRRLDLISRRRSSPGAQP